MTLDMILLGSGAAAVVLVAAAISSPSVNVLVDEFAINVSSMAVNFTSGGLSSSSFGDISSAESLENKVL